MGDLIEVDFKKNDKDKKHQIFVDTLQKEGFTDNTMSAFWEWVVELAGGQCENNK